MAVLEKESKEVAYCESNNPEHGMGCGVACVASVTGRSYDGAGLNYSHKYLRDKNDPVLDQLGTIVFIKFCPAYPRGHYLARVQGGWMNPWVNFPEIAPAKSAVVRLLPGEPAYAIFRSLNECRSN